MPAARSKAWYLVTFPMRLLLFLAVLVPLHAQPYRTAPSPASNPLTPEKVALGKKLFFDTRLSADGSISCATCHNPQRAFADNRVLSVGVFGQQTNRHAPSLVGRGFGTLQFWDGRAATLEEQVVDPILNPKEMGMSMGNAIARLQPDPAYAGLTADSLSMALASYVRTIRSVDSPFDRYMSPAGGGLCDLEREGLRLFRDKARCYICHSGDHFTDEMFHNTGISWRDGRLQDEGRATVTRKNFDKGAFKTPTLREIANTAPYMHDGSIATLDQVIEYYDRGGNANPYLDENIAPLHLSGEDKRALLAFLRALTGTVRDGL
jgi:cytochrome c peroxidase